MKDCQDLSVAYKFLNNHYFLPLYESLVVHTECKMPKSIFLIKKICAKHKCSFLACYFPKVVLGCLFVCLWIFSFWRGGVVLWFCVVFCCCCSPAQISCSVANFDLSDAKQLGSFPLREKDVFSFWQRQRMSVFYTPLCPV